jgi:hypothetical protein
MSQGYTVRDLMRDLREGRYTSIGSYPKFFLTSEGGVLSVDSVRENIWQIARATRDGSSDGWEIVACAVNWEDPDLYCEESGERIESAYAEDEVASGAQRDTSTAGVGTASRSRSADRTRPRRFAGSARKRPAMASPSARR